MRAGARIHAAFANKPAELPHRTYVKAGTVGFIVGTLVFGLFALFSGFVSETAADPRQGAIRLLIFAGAGVLIAVGVAARELSLKRD